MEGPDVVNVQQLHTHVSPSTVVLLSQDLRLKMSQSHAFVISARDKRTHRTFFAGQPHRHYGHPCGYSIQPAKVSQSTQLLQTGQCTLKVSEGVLEDRYPAWGCLA